MTILHELGHIHHNDGQGILEQIIVYARTPLAYLIPIGAAGVLLFFLSPSIPVLLVLIPISIPVIGVSAYINLLVSGYLYQKFIQLPEEKRADGFAIEHAPTHSLDGLIHFFKTAQECQKMERLKFAKTVEPIMTGKPDHIVAHCMRKFFKWALESVYPASGDGFHTSHPALSERIARLEAVKQQRRTGASSTLVRV